MIGNSSCEEPWIIEQHFKGLLIMLVLSERVSNKLEIHETLNKENKSVFMRLVEIGSYRKGESIFEEDCAC